MVRDVINIEISTSDKIGSTPTNDEPNQSDAWDAYVAANPTKNLI